MYIFNKIILLLSIIYLLFSMAFSMYIFQSKIENDTSASIVFIENTLSEEQKSEGLHRDTIENPLNIANKIATLNCIFISNLIWYEYLDLDLDLDLNE